MSYHHAIDPTDEIVCNNLFYGKGRLNAASLLRAVNPLLAGVQSPYEVFTREGPKEEVFEAIRVKEFPMAPPRRGAIFLFNSKESAEASNQAWWQGKRKILQASIVFANRIGEFDSVFLNASKDKWEQAARDYWSQARSTSPQIEVLVDGTVQLLDWEPFGRPLTAAYPSKR
jgi:hypothetical protein